MAGLIDTKGIEGKLFFFLVSIRDPKITKFTCGRSLGLRNCHLPQQKKWALDEGPGGLEKSCWLASSLLLGWTPPPRPPGGSTGEVLGGQGSSPSSDRLHWRGDSNFPRFDNLHSEKHHK